MTWELRKIGGSGRLCLLLLLAVLCSGVLFALHATGDAGGYTVSALRQAMAQKDLPGYEERLWQELEQAAYTGTRSEYDALRRELSAADAALARVRQAEEYPSFRAGLAAESRLKLRMGLFEGFAARSLERGAAVSGGRDPPGGVSGRTGGAAVLSSDGRFGAAVPPGGGTDPADPRAGGGACEPDPPHPPGPVPGLRAKAGRRSDSLHGGPRAALRRQRPHSRASVRLCGTGRPGAEPVRLCRLPLPNDGGRTAGSGGGAEIPVVAVLHGADFPAVRPGGQCRCGSWLRGGLRGHSRPHGGQLPIMAAESQPVAAGGRPGPVPGGGVSEPVGQSPGPGPLRRDIPVCSGPGRRNRRRGAVRPNPRRFRQAGGLYTVASPPPAYLPGGTRAV